MALINQGKFEEGIAEIREAIRLNPNNLKLLKLHVDLGNARHRQGKLEEAIAAYRQAIDIDPNYAEAHFCLGNVLREQGKLEASITAYRQTIRLNPNDPEAHYNLGSILFNQHRIDEAIAQFEQVIRINPDDAEVYYNLGQALLRRHDPMRAIDAVEAANYFKRARDLAKVQGNLQLFEQLNQFLPEQEGFLSTDNVRIAPSVREGDESSHRLQERRHRTHNRQQDSPASETHYNLTPLVFVIAIVLGVFLFRSCIPGIMTNQNKTQPPTQTAPRF
jgi:tetratricopeptide (TPR) repeat protein